ncbi:unnamed protein product, partial [Rotaria sp. Silwood2]
QTAEQIYSKILDANRRNSVLHVNEMWFYLFVMVHIDDLFPNHIHWFNDLEQAQATDNFSSVQKKTLIRLMKTYL